MTKTASALGVLLIGSFAALVTNAVPAKPQNSQERRSGVIRIQSNLVSILVSVIDANGQPVPDLTQDAFQLAENGVPQKIERFEAETNRPLDLALMVDASMSTFKDMKFETEAAAHFIRQVVRTRGHAGSLRVR